MLIISLLFFSLLLITSPSYNIASSDQKFTTTTDIQNGDRNNNISQQVKRYLSRFGYLQNPHVSLESALKKYQQNFGLQVTGMLDSKTLSQMITPRCGVPDIHSTHSTTNRFVYFPGKPRWSRAMPMTLTYTISRDHMIHTLSMQEIREALKRAFSRWASVIPISFVEAREDDSVSFADIKIGFYSGEHGDGDPFDGVLGVLAHSFSPEIGRIHLDAAETWAVDFEVTKSEVAVDLESVLTHEIGHLLGLSHSSVKEAVMYPSLRPRDKRADLNIDDIKGVQSLYGFNPHFKSQWSQLQSDISANHAAISPFRLSPIVFIIISLIHIYYTF